jgi:cytochrome b561
MFGIAALIIVAAIVLLLVLRLVWRLRNEQIEPGGSWGQQLFGRDKREKPDDF